MANGERYLNIGIYLAAFVALADQLSKWLILSEVLADANMVRVNSFLNFRLSWNKGVTFGLLNKFGEWGPYILIGVAVVILLLLANWLRHSSCMLAALGLGMVMGGAVGNIADRLHYGAVVDFIDFHLGTYHWYTFNLADSAIVCGVGLLLLESMAHKHGAK